MIPVSSSKSRDWRKAANGIDELRAEFTYPSDHVGPDT
jgi:hypothetical protein